MALNAVIFDWQVHTIWKRASKKAPKRSSQTPQGSLDSEEKKKKKKYMVPSSGVPILDYSHGSGARDLASRIY